MSGSDRSKDEGKWSQQVTHHSDALDLEEGVFSLSRPRMSCVSCAAGHARMTEAADGIAERHSFFGCPGLPIFLSAACLSPSGESWPQRPNRHHCHTIRASVAITTSGDHQQCHWFTAARGVDALSKFQQLRGGSIHNMWCRAQLHFACTPTVTWTSHHCVNFQPGIVPVVSNVSPQRLTVYPQVSDHHGLK